MERNEQVLSFVAEWFDPHPQLLKKYLLKYFCETNEVEMKDLTTNRKFLKRTKVPSSIAQSDFFVGGTVVLFSRDLKITDYGDDTTRKLLQSAVEKTVVVLAPKVFNLVGEVIKDIETAGFTLVNLRAFKFQLQREELEEAVRLLGRYDSIAREPGMVVALAFRGQDCLKQINDMMSSLNYGIACASTAEEVINFDKFFFSRRPTTAVYSNCTCCVIKPHAIKDRNSGAILGAILSLGFEVSAMELFHMERPAAAEFLEVYDSVVKECYHMVDELCSGPMVAMEIRAGSDVVNAFRNSVGPWDVDMAKELYPDSIRARFGETMVQNAIHCTDLPKDGINEVQYFFEVLAGSS